MKKRSTSLWIKSAFLIAVAICTLLVTTAQVFASPSDEKEVADNTLVPGGNAAVLSGTETIFNKVAGAAVNDGTTPPSAEDYAARFDGYTHVSVEDGKSIVTVFSEEQLVALQANPWNVLEGDEALYLLDDTLKLFECYDIVRIYNREGELETYKGASFYTSDEYYNSFGLITEDNSISYSLKQDIYKAMRTRLTVLCSASGDFSISGYGNEGFVYLGREKGDPDYMSYEMHAIEYYYSNAHGYLLPEDPDAEWCENCDAEDIRCMWCTAYGPSKNCFHNENNYESWLNSRRAQKSKNYGVIWFDQYRIYYVEDLSRADYRDMIKLYPDGLFDASVGNIKYDANSEKVAVFEVWDTAKESMVARIRLDDRKNPDEIAQLEALWLRIEDNMQAAPVKDIFLLTDYRVVVYLNGFAGEFGDMAFRYNADGNLDQWSFHSENSAFYPLQMLGCADVAAYVNSLLAEQLAK